jgi:hypothetical protein
MAKLSMKPQTKAGLGAAVFMGFVSILFFGNAILRVAESTANCMEQAHGAPTRHVSVLA